MSDGSDGSAPLVSVLAVVGTGLIGGSFAAALRRVGQAGRVPPSGLRSYLGVRGGAAVPPVLGSRSRDTLAGLGPAPLADGEEVVYSWIEWPSKQARDDGWAKVMADPRMQPTEEHKSVFDGQRMFWGGFEVIVDSSAGVGTEAAEREPA